MATGERVVVLVRFQQLRHKEKAVGAARIVELGLTAYGKTDAEALLKVKRMFAASVKSHRELGTLKEWLNLSGLNWFWENQYKGALPIEYADGITPQGKNVGPKPVVGKVWEDICEVGVQQYQLAA